MAHRHGSSLHSSPCHPVSALDQALEGKATWNPCRCSLCDFPTEYSTTHEAQIHERFTAVDDLWPKLLSAGLHGEHCLLFSYSQYWFTDRLLQHPSRWSCPQTL